MHWKCPGCGDRRPGLGGHDWLRCKCGIVSSNGLPLWQTKDYRTVYICKMETSHINNCIAKIINKPEWRPGYAKLLIEELERRLR